MLWVILTTFSIACSLREFKNPLLMDFWTKYNQTYLKRAADWRFLSVWSVSLWRSLLPVLCELRNEFSPITNYWIHKRGEPGHTFIMSLWISSVEKTCRIIMIHKCNNFTTILKSVSIRFYNYRDKSSHKTFWVESLPHIWKCVLFLGFSQSVEFIARVFDPFLL